MLKTIHQTARFATGKHCTNYRAKTEALKQAATLVKDSLEPYSPTVFLTDALSVLEALQTNKSPLLATQMQELGTCIVVLQWIPAHCGIPHNEQADQLAKCGAQEEQPSTSIHYQENTTIIKTALNPRQEKDAYHLLDRLSQVVLCVPATTGSTHTCTGNLKSLLPQRVPVVKRTRQPSMFFRDVTDTNQTESHSGHQQLRFT